MLTFTRGYIAIKLGLGEPPWSIHAGFILDFWLAFHWGTMSQSGWGLTWDESNHPTLSCLAAASSRERERDTHISETTWKERRSYNELQIEFLNMIDMIDHCSTCLILLLGVIQLFLLNWKVWLTWRTWHHMGCHTTCWEHSKKRDVYSTTHMHWQHYLCIGRVRCSLDYSEWLTSLAGQRFGAAKCWRSAPPLPPWAAAAPRCFAAAINPNHRQWQAHRHVCLALVIFRWTALKTLVMILEDYTTWNKFLHCGI